MLVLVAIAVIWNRTNVPQGEDRVVGAFRILGAVRLVENRGNDGDSFHIRHQGGTDVFRLYFVDTCEKSDRFPDRLGHQGRYFGGLGQDRVIKLGEEAREVVLHWLREEPFEVHTRDEHVMGGERLHAMIRFPEAASPEREWLAKRLVQEGLARIYTRGTALADGTPEKTFEKDLRALEEVARAAQRGAWAADGR